jgi:hypothetical protein
MKAFTKVGDWMLSRLMPVAPAAACGSCQCNSSGSVCGYCRCSDGRWVDCGANDRSCATCRLTQLHC